MGLRVSLTPPVRDAEGMAAVCKRSGDVWISPITGRYSPAAGYDDGLSAWQCYLELAPAVGAVGHVDLPAVQLRDALGDRQT